MNTITDKKHVDDLFKDVDFKLADLLSHVKILANSTSEKTEFEIDYNDVNGFALTMYDKIADAIDTLANLKENVDNL